MHDMIRRVYIVLLLAAVAKLGAMPPPPQFVRIYNFGGTSAIPGGELAVGPGGKLFGTTYGGAAPDGPGAIFELMPTGNGMFGFRTLYRFDVSGSPANDGQYPFAGMTLSPDGSTLFGTTQEGGSGGGTSFELNIAQAEMKPFNNGNGYTVTHAFNSATEGSKPQARPLYVGDNSFVAAGLFLFGTTYADGPNGDYGASSRPIPS